MRKINTVVEKNPDRICIKYQNIKAYDCILRFFVIPFQSKCINEQKERHKCNLQFNPRITFFFQSWFLIVNLKMTVPHVYRRSKEKSSGEQFHPIQLYHIRWNGPVLGLVISPPFMTYNRASWSLTDTK